jgi:hypothetical protein
MSLPSEQSAVPVPARELQAASPGVRVGTINHDFVIVTS